MGMIGTAYRNMPFHALCWFEFRLGGMLFMLFVVLRLVNV